VTSGSSGSRAAVVAAVVSDSSWQLAALTVQQKHQLTVENFLCLTGQLHPWTTDEVEIWQIK